MDFSQINIYVKIESRSLRVCASTCAFACARMYVQPRACARLIICISRLRRESARKSVSYLGEDSFHNISLDRNHGECPYFFLSLSLINSSILMAARDLRSPIFPSHASLLAYSSIDLLSSFAIFVFLFAAKTYISSPLSPCHSQLLQPWADLQSLFHLFLYSKCARD